MFILSSLEVNGQLTLGQWRRYTALEGTSVSEAMRDSAIAMREGYRIWICQVVCCRIYRPNACALTHGYSAIAHGFANARALQSAVASPLTLCQLSILFERA